MKSKRFKFDEAAMWERLTHDKYMEAINKSILIVRVNFQDAIKIMEDIKPDWRKNGMHGFTIETRSFHVGDVTTYEEIVLKQFDRLCFGGCIKDPGGGLSQLVQGAHSYKFVFWRRFVDVPFAFISAVLRITGVRKEYIMMDDLHMIDLGVAPTIAGECLVATIKSGVLGNACTELGMEVGLRRLNVELRAFTLLQRARYRQAGRQMNRIGRLTLKMLKVDNLTSKGRLKAKGSETRDIMPFVYETFTRQVALKLGA